MREKKFVTENIKEFMINEFIASRLKNVGYSKTVIKKTPLGDKIIIYAAKPGFVVGRKGENIKRITEELKQKFELDNPLVEIAEVENPNLDPRIVGEKIAVTLERFGVNRFKSIGHRSLDDVIKAGAMGVEILILGKVPSTRAKRWRFYQGYLKKSGDIALTQVRKAKIYAFLKSGVVGIQVRIMPSDVQLPDHIEFIDELKKEVSSEDLSDEEIAEIEREAEESLKNEKENKEADKKEDNINENKEENKNNKKVNQDKEKKISSKKV